MQSQFWPLGVLASRGRPHPESTASSVMDEMKPKIQIWLELETRCNLRCQFCYNYWRGEPFEEPMQIPVPALLPALDVLLDGVDCSSITISGGEPLLRKDLFAILDHVHKCSITIVITMNVPL